MNAIKKRILQDYILGTRQELSVWEDYVFPSSPEEEEKRKRNNQWGQIVQEGIFQGLAADVPGSLSSPPTKENERKTGISEYDDWCLREGGIGAVSLFVGTFLPNYSLDNYVALTIGAGIFVDIATRGYNKWRHKETLSPGLIGTVRELYSRYKPVR